MLLHRLLICFIPIVSACLAFGDEENISAPSFEGITVDASLPRAYQVAIADINQDGRLDLAALGEGRESMVAWYENPSWKRRPISGDETTSHIDLAFYDLDRDGELEVALASDFNLGETVQGGTVSWLDRNDDLDQPWRVYPIHSEPTSHRFRWADLDGDGRKELVNLPVVGIGSKPPRYHQVPVRLLVYTIPGDPKHDSWRIDPIDRSLHIAHGLFVCDINRNGRDDILTASVEGITRFQRIGDRWRKTQLCKGLTGGDGLTGSSEVALGRTSGGDRFLATIDPWHGHQAAVYTRRKSESDFSVERTVIDDTFVSGHAIACADFDKDGSDEIIAGFRGKGHTIYYYDYRKTTRNRSVIDRDVAVQGFAVGDVDGDGKIDFAAAGGSTHNVKLYLNRGMK